jgi:hypothetical protein
MDLFCKQRCKNKAIGRLLRISFKKFVPISHMPVGQPARFHNNFSCSHGILKGIMVPELNPKVAGHIGQVVSPF